MIRNLIKYAYSYNVHILKNQEKTYIFQ